MTRPAANKRPPQQKKPSQYSSGMARRLARLNEWMDARPLLDYTMTRTIVLVLAGLGVIMVTSSSMTWSVLDDLSLIHI